MHCGHEMPYIGQERPAIRKHILGKEKKGIYIKTIKYVCVRIYIYTYSLRLNRANKIRRAKNHKRAKL